jgi:hypothetical protein
VSARTPEGKLKERCRGLCKRLGLFWANVEGKGFNGFPDTAVGKYPKGSGIIILEAKRPGLVTDQADFERRYEQQWKRIREIREAGGEADWYDTYEGFCEKIGYDLDL